MSKSYFLCLLDRSESERARAREREQESESESEHIPQSIDFGCEGPLLLTGV